MYEAQSVLCKAIRFQADSTESACRAYTEPMN